jgi:hypothetical protein
MISSFLALSLAFGCGRAGEGAVPGPISGWEKTSYSAHHTPEDLHEYMNGGAAKYLAYSIQELYVQEYTRSGDGFTAVIELYRMDSPQNAYGVFSSDRSGPHPDGDWQEGTYGTGLLQFWQGRYYVRVQAVDPSGNPEDKILELGRKVSVALKGSDPEGAASVSPLPELAAKMPAQGLVEDSLCFFHNQVSLNSIYYLSNKNILNLGLGTDAVSALYRVGGERSARVIAICYLDSRAASDARDAFLALSCGDQPAEAGTDDAPREGGKAGQASARTGEAQNAEPPMGAHSIVRDNLLVVVLDAPTNSAAKELCGRIAAATRCAGEEGK